MDTIAMQLPIVQAKPEATIVRKNEAVSNKSKGLFQRVLDKTSQPKEQTAVLAEEKIDPAQQLPISQDGLPIQVNTNDMILLMAGLVVPPAATATVSSQLSTTAAFDTSATALLAVSDQPTPSPINQTIPQQLPISLQGLFKAQADAPQTTNISTTSTTNNGGAMTLGEMPSTLPSTSVPTVPTVPTVLQPTLPVTPVTITTETNGIGTNVETESAKSLPFVVKSGLEVTNNTSEIARTDNLHAIPDANSVLPTPQSLLASAPVETVVLSAALQSNVLPGQNDIVRPIGKQTQTADKPSVPGLLNEVAVSQKLVDVQQNSENTTQDSIFSSNHAASEVRATKPNDTSFEVLPPTQTTDQHNIVAQVVDRARLYLRPANNSEMVIQLRPEHLGELTLKVSVQNGIVSAAFHSDNHEVRQAIEASLPQLKQELSQQGIKLDNVGVYTGSDQFFDNGQRSSQQQQQIPLRKTTREFLQTVESAEEVTVRTTEGVDYRV